MSKIKNNQFKEYDHVRSSCHLSMISLETKSLSLAENLTITLSNQIRQLSDNCIPNNQKNFMNAYRHKYVS